MKRTCTRVLRSALSLVLVFCLALSLCGAAFATESDPVAYIGATGYETVQKALDAAVASKGTVTVELVSGMIDEDIEIVQTPGLYLTLSGADSGVTVLDGVLVINGGSQRYENQSVTIENITFEAKNISGDRCISIPDSSKRYSRNVTVVGCVFRDSGETLEKVAVKQATGGCMNWVIRDCVVDSFMHSLLQADSFENITIDNCKIYSKNGINLDDSKTAEITDCEIDVRGYAVRVGAKSGGYDGNETVVLTGNTIHTSSAGEDPAIELRGSAVNAQLKLSYNAITTEGAAAIESSNFNDSTQLDIAANYNYWGGGVPVIDIGGNIAEQIVEHYYTEKTQIPEALYTKNYVSIGDSMANGYGLIGYEQTSDDRNVYDLMTGEGMYGEGAYPDQVEEHLKSVYRDVEHVRLATSGMIASDLLYLLGGTDAPIDDAWEGYLHYVGTYSDEEVREYFQKSVSDADIISLGIGNGSFGAYLMAVLTTLLEMSPGEEPDVDLEDALSLLKDSDPEMEAFVLELYADLKAGLLGYTEGIDLPMEQICDVLVYAAASHLVSFKGVLEQIDELNKKNELDIILVGLANNLAGVEFVSEDMTLPMGDIMDDFFKALNIYMAGLPTAMQEMGELEGITFYYAEEMHPEFISEVFVDMYDDGDWTPDNPDGIDANTLRNRTINAVDNYVFENLGIDESVAQISGALNKTITQDENTAALYFLAAVYQGVEKAVAANINEKAIPLESFINLPNLKDMLSGQFDIETLATMYAREGEDAVINEVYNILNADDFAGMCTIFGLFLVGDGMAAHPSAAGHDEIAAAVIDAYGKKHTAKDETIDNIENIEKNIEVTLDALYNVLVTYGPEVAAEVWAQWEEYDYVESVEKTMGELEEMLTARYTYYTETALPAIEGAVGELAARKDVLCTELDALKAELEAKKAELEKVISEQEIGSVTLPDISIDIQLGNNEQTEVPENECLGVIEGASVEAELQAAIADLEHAIAVIEALITDIEADIADMVALAEQIAAAVAELEKTMEEIAAAAEDLAAAVEAAIAVLMDNEGVIDAVIKSFDAARATVLAANEVLELTLGVAEEITADIDTMIEKIAVDAEALYNKFLEELPGCIEQIPEEGMMLIGGAIAAAQYGLEEGKALIEARLQEELVALEAEYGMSEEEINAKLAELAAEYGISEESIRAELEAINAEIEAEVNAQYAAIEEQLKADIAALEAEAAAKIEALEAELAGYQAELEAAAEDAIEGIQAQIDRVTGDIAAVNEDLACAIEHLEAAAQTAYDQIVAEVTAAYEAAIAELEKALADLEAAYNEAVAALKDELAALKEAYDKAVDELTAAADKAIADLTAKVEEQLAELDKLGEELAEIAGTIYDEIHDELEDAQTAIEEILKGNLDAIEDLKNALVELGAESVIDLVESIVAQIEAMFEEATTDDYVITPDSYYVAIGDGSAETESYVEELAAYLGIDCNNLAENGQEMEDAYGVIADNAEDIAAADLITIGYSNSTFVGDAAEAALNGADLDWSTYVTDAGVAYVEDVLADISAELAANGITGELNDMAMAAIESYAYSSVAYACNLPGVVSAIRQINEDAVVIIVGQHNAFAGTTISAMGVEIDLGEYVDYLVDGAAVHGIAYCMITGDAIYVEAPNAATDTPAVIGIKELYGLLQDDSALYPNATGDLYIRDCILNALNITTQGLLGDADSNGVVNTTDAQLVLYYYTGKQTNVAINASVCDVDGNGAVNTSDAQLILYYYTGKITKFPVEN